MFFSSKHRYRQALMAVSLLVSSVSFVSLLGCALSAGRAPSMDVLAFHRQQALAEAVPMPDNNLYTTRYFEWSDSSRHRTVGGKLYMPVASQRDAAQAVPLIVMSHGIGGSREGYSYLGKFWASKGYASLHLQHPGSDVGLWLGNPLSIDKRMQEAAKESEAIDRAHDMRFALTQLLQSELVARFDAKRIIAAGHSYGASTSLLVAGAKVQREVGGVMKPLDLSDPRFQAAVIISAPPFYGERDISSILSPIHIPTLHITATGDEIIVPGYESSAKDRITVYEAMSHGAQHDLAVFKDGSHSMFTDRLVTGGSLLNPKAKVATRELTLAFFAKVFENKPQAMKQWVQAYQPLLARFEEKL